jgi:hypothetical protein
MFRSPTLNLVLTLVALLLLLAAPARADDLPFQATDVIVTYTDVQDLGDGNYRFMFDVEGSGTTLGDFTGSGLADYSYGTELLSNASMTLGGADGSISFTFDGYIDGKTGELEGVTFTIFDGTDAYEGASGGGTITGMADATNGAIISFDGVITTP